MRKKRESERVKERGKRTVRICVTSMEIKQKMFSVKRGDCCVATSTGAAATSTAVDCLPACLTAKYANT